MIGITGASGLIGQAVSGLVCKTFHSEFKSGKIQFLVSDSASAYERDGQKRLFIKKSPYVVTKLVTGLGLYKLVRSLEQLGPESHLIFSSSVAVSDNRSAPWTPSTEGTLEVEGQASPYTRSKIWAEQWLIEAGRKSDFRPIILRFVTVYLKHPRPNSIFDLMLTVVVKGSLAVRLNWPGRTSVVHAEDAAEAMLRLAVLPPRAGETQMVIVNAEALTLAEISDTLHSLLVLNHRRKYFATLCRAPF